MSLFLWFWAIWDLSKSRFKKTNLKFVWLLIVLFFPFFGSIFYFQLKKEFTIKQRHFKPDFSQAKGTF
ncbi:PLD nuclease N-terminal domain-containing protein [Zunongwangia sp. HRR-M8]|uniref:PLD nuclease N-terminal domain-containing protein n=1 Tax=Zunongwangia sp. HRR-M8 TaxID=3015170 RepID=UPI0022DDE22A|nr:PLD nuclease N-terminal domain-containing protein [Zunongwangia sp. HRR-M8]WBL23967.1 PLD nuclease N-terminal domain-containing protein [Zunongwangia sp. HRR-M8]